MGSGISEKIIPATGNLTVVHRGLQVGELRSASAIVTIGDPSAGSVWVYLALCQGAPVKANVSVPITKGYVTEEDPLLWNGRIHLNGTYTMVGFCRASTEVTVRIFAYVDIRGV